MEKSIEFQSKKINIFRSIFELVFMDFFWNFNSLSVVVFKGFFFWFHFCNHEEAGTINRFGGVFVVKELWKNPSEKDEIDSPKIGIKANIET